MLGLGTRAKPECVLRLVAFFVSHFCEGLAHGCIVAVNGGPFGTNSKEPNASCIGALVSEGIVGRSVCVCVCVCICFFAPLPCSAEGTFL